MNAVDRIAQRAIEVGTISPPDPSGDTPFGRHYRGVMPEHFGTNDWEDIDLKAANDNHPQLPKVVALTGLAGSGKSTLADYLIQRHGYRRVKFAGPLKAMLKAIGLTDEHIEGQLKEQPCALLQGRTPRYFLQRLGTEFGRDTIGPAFWTGLWSTAANDILAAGGRVVCDDCRFDNEVDTIHSAGGVVIELKGRGGIAGQHQSEQGVDADVVLRNDGSIGELQARADEVLFGGLW